MIGTRPKEYDRKLLRIVKEAKKGNFRSALKLAESLEKAEADEFSTKRAGVKKVSSAATIEKFVTYAQVISLLDSKFKPEKPPKDLDNIGGFQDKLSNNVIDYLKRNHSYQKEIIEVVNKFLEENPPIVPTIKNVHGKLQGPPPLDHFEYSVKIISRLRSGVFKLQSKPVFIIEDIIEG